MFRGGESQVVLRRIYRFKTEDLYVSPGLTLEMKPCRHDLGVIEHHQSPGREQFRNIPEDMFIHIAARIAEKFGGVALRQRVFRDLVVREIIVVVLNAY